MCYDARSSIQSFAFITVTSGLLFYYGDKYDKHIALFLFVVIQMQLAEYFMWMDQECNNMNKYATYYAFFVLFIQPLSVLWGGYYFKTLNISFYTYVILTIVHSCLFLMKIFEYSQKPGKICSKPNKTKHLEWDFARRQNDNEYIVFSVYFLCMTIPWLFMKNFKKGVLGFLFITFTFFYHFIFYKDDWKTLWCYSIRYATILYIFVTRWKNIMSLLTF